MPICYWGLAFYWGGLNIFSPPNPLPLPLSQSHGGSKASAIRDFTTLYHDKTGNAWENRDRDSFVKHAGKFYPLEIDYGQEQEDLAKMSVGVGSCSTLAPAVQELVRLLFDVESMKRAMLEFEVGRCRSNHQWTCFLFSIA